MTSHSMMYSMPESLVLFCAAGMSHEGQYGELSQLTRAGPTGDTLHACLLSGRRRGILRHAAPCTPPTKALGHCTPNPVKESLTTTQASTVLSVN